MTTLYSAAVTIKGEKKRSVSFELEYGERQALKELATVVIAISGLTPTAADLVCGTRMSAKWCHTVADGMEDLLGLKEEETLTISGEHLKDLRTIRKHLNAIFKNSKAADEDLTIDSIAVGQLVTAGGILTAYKDDQIGLITINNNSVTRARIEETVEFLKGVHKNVLIK